MTTTADLHELSEMRWLVAARNAIQTLMLDLHERFPPTEASDDLETRVKRHTLLGAAFSLWRAVFLVSTEDAARKVDETDAHARAFLEQVIKTNAITFNDDRNSRRWSGGYYLNNARDRILRVSPTADVPASISEAVLKVVWNRLYFALSKMVSELPVRKPEDSASPSRRE